MVNLQLSPERQLIIFETLYFRRPVVFYSSAAKLLRVLVFFFLLLLDFFQHDTAYINAAQQLTKPEYNNLWPPLWYTQQQHFKQRIYQMAATNSQVAKRSRGDSGISAAGFLSGPEETGCSLGNWITGLFLISKGCELSRGLAWWNQSGSWNSREKNNKSFSKVSWHRPSS